MSRAKDTKRKIDALSHDRAQDVLRWIDSNLIPVFLNTHKRTVSVSSTNADLLATGAPKEVVMDVLRSEEFVVKYECDDRPCATPYYIISLPQDDF